MRGKIKTFYRSSKTKVHYVILVVIPKQHGVALYLVGRPVNYIQRYGAGHRCRQYIHKLTRRSLFPSFNTPNLPYKVFKFIIINLVNA